MWIEGIRNLKLAQLRNNQLLTFKDHSRRWTRVYPQNAKFPYKENDLIKFSLKGADVDYINFNSSALVVTIKTFNSAKEQAALLLPWTILGILKRYQLRSGIEDVEDIMEYGKMIWAEKMGTWKRNAQKIDQGWFSYKRQNYVHNGEYTFRIPLVTLLDMGGYIPAYNLAEQLKIIFTLAPNEEVLASQREELWGETVQAGSYEIADLYWLIDGIVVRSGGEMDPAPYKFMTTSCYAIREVQEASIKTITNYDLHRTSLKKFMMFFQDLPQNFVNMTANTYTTYDQLANMRPLGLNGLAFSLGGVLWPYRNGLTNLLEMWFQFQKFFSRYDSSGNEDNYLVEYEDGWKAPMEIHEPIVSTGYINPNNWREGFALGAGTLYFPPTGTNTQIERTMYAVTLDVLDQENNVVSGMESERVDVQVQLSFDQVPRPIGYGTDPDENEGRILWRYSYFYYDVVVQIIGGQIKVEY